MDAGAFNFDADGLAEHSRLYALNTGETNVLPAHAHANVAVIDGAASTRWHEGMAHRCGRVLTPRAHTLAHARPLASHGYSTLAHARPLASHGYSTLAHARPLASHGYSTLAHARPLASDGHSTLAHARPLASHGYFTRAHARPLASHGYSTRTRTATSQPWVLHARAQARPLASHGYSTLAHTRPLDLHARIDTSTLHTHARARTCAHSARRSHPLLQ